MNRLLSGITFAIAVAGVTVVAGQRGGVPGAVQQFVKVDAPVLALTHVRVIDGTGAPARENQTLVVQNGRITALGNANSVSAPEDATVIDATGKSVIPGLVMLH